LEGRVARQLGFILAAIFAVTLWLTPASWAASESRDAAVHARVFPGADGFGPPAGTPPAIAAYSDGQVVGYVFFTRDVVQSVGFSAKPLDVAVGLDFDGHITGAEIVEHHEPILVIGVAEADLAAFVDQYRGVDIRSSIGFSGETRAASLRLDAVSGATVSSLFINDSVMRAARAVARSRGIIKGIAAALDVDSFTAASWTALLDSGALARLDITNGMVDDALRSLGAPGYGAEVTVRNADARFIDFYGALVTPAAIGQNLMRPRDHDRLMSELQPGDQVILLAARGLYSFKGTGWRREGIFDRIQIAQGAHSFRLLKHQHRRVRIIAEGAPELREAAVFVMPRDTGFDPTAPWRVDLLVKAEAEEGPVYSSFALPYRIPDVLIRSEAERAAALAPLWRGVWLEQASKVLVLVVALVMLTGYLIFQDAIVQSRRLYLWLRYGFLGFTVVWIGWYAGAQLSVVNVITFSQALLVDFRWDVFLVAPLIFVLWSYVALAMLFWGRGVYCGWLCPFGAMQELLNRGARVLKVPQISVPFIVHERLWALKYIIFLGLFALAFGGYDAVQPLTEVEPFKTAIVMHFVRAGPFVAYAVLLLLAGLFIERFFCRYLCPLGAALAIPARLRMFEWLMRRWQCGAQCQRCAHDCTVQAIHPDGRINPNECIHCLNCQVLYYDDHTCPPLIERRKRLEKALKAQESLKVTK
jgi:NosR/NirI family transcriptional regulator, nitrous oxide reductase regulator